MKYIAVRRKQTERFLAEKENIVFNKLRKKASYKLNYKQ